MAGPVSIPLVKKGLMVAGAAGAYAFGSAASLIKEGYDHAKKEYVKSQTQKPRKAQSSSELKAKD